MGQRKTGHVTLGDIARASGFSVSTVSIVLSDAPLSKNVAATHADAHPRPSRGGWATIRTPMRAACGGAARRRSASWRSICPIRSAFPSCAGSRTGCTRPGYLPLLMDAQTERKLFDKTLHMILEQRAEAVIVLASWVFEETNLLGDMRKNNVPILIVGRDLTARGISSILVDNEAGGALAMRHLVELGHREIAVIRGPKEMCDSEPRWAGIERVAAEAGLRIDPRLIFELPGLADPASGFEGGLKFARQMLKSGAPFTAVLAFDDMTALGVVRGLREAGARVPEDCSVMGFDDVLPAEVATPAMSTVRQPLKEMGREAADAVSEGDPAAGRAGGEGETAFDGAGAGGADVDGEGKLVARAGSLYLAATSF